MTAAPPARHRQWPVIALLMAIAASAASAHWRMTPAANSYSPAEDVELGREAAEEARKRFPLLDNADVRAYVEGIGHRLSGHIPEEFRQPAFRYSFDVTNVSQLTSVAFPGGSILVSRGLIEIARTEGELAGIIAHQLSHVALRHGTAQLTSGERFQIGGILGRTIGAVAAVAGKGVAAQGVNFGVSTYFLMYSPELERQADLLAGRLMESAGYDPGDIDTVFRTIGAAGVGRGGPQWIRSHPPTSEDLDADPPESASVEKEVPRAEGSPGSRDTIGSIQARLSTIPAEYLVKDGPGDKHYGVKVGLGRYGAGVVEPSGEFRSVTAGDALLLNVPSNWERHSAGNTVTFAPDRAYAETPDGPVITHGVQIAVARSLTGSLEDDTHALIESLGQRNPQLRWTLAFQHTKVGDRSGLTTAISNISPVTGEFEQILVSTAHLPGDTFLYVIGVAPQTDGGVYRKAFDRILESIQLVN